jgi:hypothetical protein
VIFKMSLQDESQDESHEAMPEDPGAELSEKYDFAKRLEEHYFAKPQDKIRISRR